MRSKTYSALNKDRSTIRNLRFSKRKFTKRLVAYRRAVATAQNFRRRFYRETVKMSLEVIVKSASSLPNVERWGKSDPMTVLIFQGGHLLTLSIF